MNYNSVFPSRSAISTPMHRLTGATKALLLLMLSIAAMVSFDTAVLAMLFGVALVGFLISRIRIREHRFFITIAVAFLVINNLFVFLMAPEYGAELFGTRTVLVQLGPHIALTFEQLFYQINLTLKIAIIITAGMVFFYTTDPSELAASLNRIGLSYRICYSVSLSMRYIPDVRREYRIISQAQQAKGVVLSKKANVFVRIKNSAKILIPLVMSSFQRIDTISNAMEVRSFGKGKRRTWYYRRDFHVADYVALLIGISITVFSIVCAIL